MGKAIVKISGLPIGNKFWDISDFGKVESRLGERFLLKNNIQQFFFDYSYSEKVKDFGQMVGKLIPNSHEKFRICQFEQIKAAFKWPNNC